MKVNPEFNPAFRTDDEIEEDLLSLLEEDTRIDEIDIDVKVVNGAVKLSGTAESAEEAEMVESLAQRVEGVIDVANEIYVVKIGHTQAPWPGREPEPEAELEGIEVEPGDREATEDYMAAVDEGLPFIPPDEPEFPAERDAASEVRRREVAEERFRERRKKRKHDTDKVEGQEL